MASTDDSWRPTPSQVLASELAGIRKRQGLSAEALGQRVQELGGKLDQAAISKVENGTRGVSLDETLLLAFALGVAPVHLVTPRDDDAMVTVVPAFATTAEAVRRWVRGIEPLPNVDDRTFRTEVPESEWTRRGARKAEAEERVERAGRRVRVAREKLDMLTVERGQLENRTHRLQLNLAGADVAGKEDRLDARIDVAYDQVADAKVELEDAQSALRLLDREGY